VVINFMPQPVYSPGKKQPVLIMTNVTVMNSVPIVNESPFYLS
jgi:hypothetical protein